MIDANVAMLGAILDACITQIFMTCIEKRGCICLNSQRGRCAGANQFYECRLQWSANHGAKDGWEDGPERWIPFGVCLSARTCSSAGPHTRTVLVHWLVFILQL